MESAEQAIEVTLAHDHRQAPVDRVECVVRAVLEGEGATWHYVGVVLADAERVRALNRTYLQHDYETDVLSFALHEADDPVEGEVYVDLDTAARVADELGLAYEDEVVRYVAHGVLHLCGYDDDDERGRANMRRLEDHYLEVC